MGRRSEWRKKRRDGDAVRRVGADGERMEAEGRMPVVASVDVSNATLRSGIWSSLHSLVNHRPSPNTS